MVKQSITVKRFICKKCKHEIVYHTDIVTLRPDVCSICKGTDFQEKRSES